MNIYNHYFAPNEDASVDRSDCNTEIWLESEKYTIRKIIDHKSINYFLAMMGSKITQQEVCECQNDIYAIINQETKENCAVIMGRREFEMEKIEHVVADPEYISTIRFLIMDYTTSMTDPPSYKLLCLLLSEFLADKNYCMSRYKLTGKETDDMLTALRAVGFKPNGEWYTRMPFLPKEFNRY